jgi:hypothetical protein
MVLQGGELSSICREQWPHRRNAVKSVLSARLLSYRVRRIHEKVRRGDRLFIAPQDVTMSR